MKRIRISFKKKKYLKWANDSFPALFMLFLVIGLIYYIGFISYGVAVKENYLRTVESKLEGLMQQNNSTVVEKPTLREVISFMQKDSTDSHEYSYMEYDCEDFTSDLIKNASRAGLNAHSVVIRWQGEYMGHNVVGFETSDYGMVFFEPQDDTLLEIYPGAEILGKTVADYHVME